MSASDKGQTSGNINYDGYCLFFDKTKSKLSMGVGLPIIASGTL